MHNYTSEYLNDYPLTVPVSILLFKFLSLCYLDFALITFFEYISRKKTKFLFLYITTVDKYHITRTGTSNDKGKTLCSHHTVFIEMVASLTLLSGK